jgi:hypothetical protein
VSRHQLERQRLLPWSNSRMSNCTLLHTASVVLQLDQCLLAVIVLALAARFLLTWAKKLAKLTSKRQPSSSAFTWESNWEHELIPEIFVLVGKVIYWYLERSFSLNMKWQGNTELRTMLMRYLQDQLHEMTLKFRHLTLSSRWTSWARTI